MDTPTDRMLLALHDAAEAAHDTHRQVDEHARAWFERLGKERAEAMLATTDDTKHEEDDR